MAATVSIVQRIGASGAPTDSTVSGATCRFSSKETLVATSATPPITIPAAGSTWSFEKWLSFRIDGTPPADKIFNLKAYSDGNNGWTGVNLWYKNVAIAGYTQPTATVTSSNLTNFFTATAGSPVTLTTASYSTTGTVIGGWLALSMEVLSTAGPGTLTAETATFSYDEI